MARSCRQDLVLAFATDRRAYGTTVALRRLWRMAPLLRALPARRTLAGLPSLRAHVDRVAPGDPLFWLSHRSYLATGLDAPERTALALAHYAEEERRFGPGYHESVYGEAGLCLWRTVDREVGYDVRLMAGNDVMHEGGLSVVLFVDGARVCVVSFSWTPMTSALDPWGADGLVPFVTRKQLTGDRGYQPAFHRAFDRVTPAHLCLAALDGLVGVCGHERLVGIAAARHPAQQHAQREQFLAAYDRFWRSLDGQPTARLGFDIPLPLRLTPLEALDGARRRRAAARRAHMDAVRRSATAAVEPLLRGP